MIDYTLILSRRYNAEWTLDGNSYQDLNWLSDSPKPSKKELDDQWDSVLKEIETEATAKAASKAALLEKLGITAEEARLILG
jgi:hypothetical protein